MAFLRLVALLLILVFLQLGIVPHLEIGGASPDLFFLLVVHLSLSTAFHRVYAFQWFVGFVKDLYTGGDAGVFSALYLLAGMVLSRFRSGFFADHAMTQGAITLLACGQTQVLAVLFLNLRHPHIDWGALAGRVGIIALYTAVVSPIAFPVFRSVLDGDRRRSRR